MSQVCNSFSERSVTKTAAGLVFNHANRRELYFRFCAFVKTAICVFTMAQRAIERLERLRTLKQTGDAKRDLVYCAKELLDILEEPAHMEPASVNDSRSSPPRSGDYQPGSFHDLLCDKFLPAFVLLGRPAQRWPAHNVRVPGRRFLGFYAQSD